MQTSQCVDREICVREMVYNSAASKHRHLTLCILLLLLLLLLPVANFIVDFTTDRYCVCARTSKM